MQSDHTHCVCKCCQCWWFVCPFVYSSDICDPLIWCSNTFWDGVWGHQKYVSQNHRNRVLLRWRAEHHRRIRRWLRACVLCYTDDLCKVLKSVICSGVYRTHAENRLKTQKMTESLCFVIQMICARFWRVCFVVEYTAMAATVNVFILGNICIVCVIYLPLSALQIWGWGLIWKELLCWFVCKPYSVVELFFLYFINL